MHVYKKTWKVIITIVLLYVHCYYYMLLNGVKNFHLS